MKSFDVIIIGRGLTGVSTAWHLAQLGVQRICLVGPTPTHDLCASLNAGYAHVTLHDNITRSIHSQGSKITRDLLDLNRAGFCGLLDFVRENKIEHRLGCVSRVAETPHEAREMAAAVTWLQTNGFSPSLTAFGKRTVQQDGAAAASIDIAAVLGALERQSNAYIHSGTVGAIQRSPDGLAVTTTTGTTIHAEMVVAACHVGIKNLIPEMSEALVNHADQWMEFEIQKGELRLSRGDLVFSGHSQFWMTYSHRGTVIAGGARFLRPWAGVEATSSSVLPGITTAVKSKIERLFAISLSQPVQTIGALDLRACDEIPMIGPMFGESRILLAGGYMGSGLTLGFAAGRGLSQFIQSGHSTLVSDAFYPIRLRSLPKSPTFE
jgi:glycine/D-amino acid oxidase-like deaminating enzyme